MQFQFSLGTLLLAVLVIALLLGLFTPVAEISPETCERIEPGMTEREAFDIVGAPPGWYGGVGGISSDSLPRKGYKPQWIGSGGEIVVDLDDQGRVTNATFYSGETLSWSFSGWLWERLTRVRFLRLSLTQRLAPFFPLTTLGVWAVGVGCTSGYLTERRGEPWRRGPARGIGCGSRLLRGPLLPGSCGNGSASLGTNPRCHRRRVGRSISNSRSNGVSWPLGGHDGRSGEVSIGCHGGGAKVEKMGCSEEHVPWRPHTHLPFSVAGMRGESTLNDRARFGDSRCLVMRRLGVGLVGDLGFVCGGRHELHASDCPYPGSGGSA